MTRISSDKRADAAGDAPIVGAQTLTSADSGLDAQLYAAGLGPVAGVDEAGRGACCGPVTIAACILPYPAPPELARLTDSKKLTPRARERFFELLHQVAEGFAVVHVSAADVDRWGIQHANVSGMRRAVAQLPISPGYVLTDAVKVPGLAQPHLPVLKGDQVSLAISAASVLAKVSRDRLMQQLDDKYPGYGLAAHKGYGTAAHMDAVRLHGATPEHRYTYSNVAAAQAQFQQQLGR